MKRLSHLADLSAMGVSGKRLGEVLADYEVPAQSVICSANAPLSSNPAIVIVKGSLSADGGIIKMGLRWDRPLRFEGRAKCFPAWDLAVAALKAGKIVAGDVVVLRGIGVMGGPGMGMASRIVFALDGAGLGPHVAVVTDGQLSGLVNKGLVVGEVTPEAAVGGTLALVEDGDRIVIDVTERRCDLDVPADMLEVRKAKWRAPAAPADNSWVNVYARSVQPLSRGAALVGRAKSDPSTS